MGSGWEVRVRVALCGEVEGVSMWSIMIEIKLKNQFLIECVL